MLHHGSRDITLNSRARSLFQRALGQDAKLVLAHYGLGLCHYDAVLNQLPDGNREALLASAQRCIDLAPHSAEGYYLLGRHHQVRGRHSDAIAEWIASVRIGAEEPVHEVRADSCDRVASVAAVVIGVALAPEPAAASDAGARV